MAALLIKSKIEEDVHHTKWLAQTEEEVLQAKEDLLHDGWVIHKEECYSEEETFFPWRIEARYLLNQEGE